jgi:hypothetical protein
MTTRRSALSVFVLAVLLAGCAAEQSPQPSVTEGAGAPGESPATSPTAAATIGPETLGEGERDLEAGTYRLDLTPDASGAGAYPAFLVTVPAGWSSLDGWTLGRPATDGGPALLSVAITFWNVDQVYGHPCQWEGTLSRPGPGVDDLVAALLDVPMRSQTDPKPVEIDGQPGTYLEWSVPSDIEFDEQGNFPECDGDGAGQFDFRSWTGTGFGGSTRYHQGPGQVDRLWILDVDGRRLVIDAFSMPTATDEEVEEMLHVVESIQFLDE